MRSFLVVALVPLLTIAEAAWSRSQRLTTEEFVGPFSSWANVKTDYGAIGDGKIDDTAALQRALEDIRRPDFSKRVLYFPAGTYRITGTLKLLRETHTQSQGVCLYGEDPERTILRWDGAANGIMFHYNPWYASMGRLTFDGAGQAKTAIEHGVAFTTANEYTDMIVKDVQFGIEAGMRDGIAETAVLRCRFYRCSKAAISIQNFNSLDWYLWHCLFEDCGIGITNEFGAGNFHVYESLFRRSKEADITMRHCGYFSFYGNTSALSKAFFIAKRALNWKDTETWGANVTLQRNTIIDPQDPTPIRIENNGPILLLDNVLRCRAGARVGPAVVHSCPSEVSDMISIGNTFTVSNPVVVKGRLTTFDDRVVSRTSLKLREPSMVPFLPRVERPIIEVKAGAESKAIQEAVDEAATLKGKRPLVHLPAGTYNLRQTVVLPAGCDLQLVGDGLLQATQLNWTGESPGPALRVIGPTHATLRNFGVNAGRNTVGIVVDHCDQPGSRIFMEQAQTMGYDYGLVMDGLDNAYVALHDHGHNAMKTIGGARAAKGNRPPGITALFCGASSRDKNSRDEGVDLYAVEKGARLLVRDIWYEGQIWHFLNLTDAGEFVYHSGNIAPYAGPTPDSAVINIDGFRGKITLSQIKPINGPVRVKGGGKDQKVLLLGLINNNAPLDVAKASPETRVVYLNGRNFRPNGTGTDSLPEVGKGEPGFLRDMLNTLRTELPRPLYDLKASVTDLRFYRVMVYGREGIRLQYD